MDSSVKQKLLAEFLPEHQELLHKYLNFFSQKKDRCINEVETAFEQVRERHEKQNLFSKHEMEGVLNDMEGEMRDTFKSELEIFYRMSAVMIQMIMFDAEKQNSSIKADVGYMENYKAIQAMKDFESIQMESEFSLTGKKKVVGALPNLGAPVKVEKVIVQDEDAKKQNIVLEALVKDLQRKMELMQIDQDTMKKESKESKTSARELELEEEIRNLQAQMEMKINQNPTVVGMKKMIQEKNTLVNELREKLAKYENQ